MASPHPKLTEELVRQLLDAGEYAGLDYKASLDVSMTAELIAVTKDVGALQARAEGGFLLIGANDDGSLSGLVNAVHVQLLDEARLRPKLAKYLPDPIQVATRAFDISKQTVVLIHVAAHPAGYVVFKADGNYERSSGKPATEFRAGDVFIRRGTSSERCRQADWEAIIENIVAARKESWREELREELAQLGVAADAQRIAKGPAAAMTWQLDADAFVASIVELLRAGDTIPMELLLQRIPRDAQALLDEGRDDDLTTLIDRVGAFAAVGLTLNRDQLVQQATDTLLRIYNLGFDAYGIARRVPNQLPSEKLWLTVVERVLLLGAFAVRRRDWTTVRSLVLRKGSGQDFDDCTNWLRHALTVAARANMLTHEQGGQRQDVALLTFAQELGRREAALRPDISESDDELLNSLCQFDVLAALAVFDQNGGSDRYYPNFARFNWYRAEPALLAMITDPDARQAIFPRPDPELAAAVRDLEQMARGESFRYAIIDEWRHKKITDFMAANPG